MTLDIYELIAWSIDFEGWIRIGRTISKNGINNYLIEIGVSNTNKELLESFKNRIKLGKIYGPYYKENYKKPKYNLIFNKKEIRQHLSLIQPFLNAKWRQGELVLEILIILKSKEECNKLSYYEKRELYTWEEFMTLESCYNECRILNEKGVRQGT